MANPWLFREEQLLLTPSMKDGLTNTQEVGLRVDGAKFIKSLGTVFQLHYNTIATATVFFHRFYMFYSFRLFPIHPTAATCLFLAGKAEETPKKSNDIVRHARSILSDADFAAFGPDPKEEILTLERILLQTLRFDLEVEHPYDYLIKYVKQITVSKEGQTEDEAHKGLLQAAWTFLNDSCCTTVCLRYEPEIVAIAMILMASKTGSFVITDWDSRRPHHKEWWDVHVENLDPNTLETICHQVLDIYQNITSVSTI